MVDLFALQAANLLVSSSRSHGKERGYVSTPMGTPGGVCFPLIYPDKAGIERVLVSSGLTRILVASQWSQKEWFPA